VSSDLRLHLGLNKPKGHFVLQSAFPDQNGGYRPIDFIP